MAKEGANSSSIQNNSQSANNSDELSKSLYCYSLTAEGLNKALLDNCDETTIHTNKNYQITYNQGDTCIAAARVNGYKANEDRTTVSKISDIQFPNFDNSEEPKSKIILTALAAQLQRKYGLPSQAAGATLTGVVIAEDGVHTINIGDSAILRLDIDTTTTHKIEEDGSKKTIISHKATITRQSKIHNLSNPDERDHIAGKYEAHNSVFLQKGTPRLAGIFYNTAGSRTIGDQSVANSALSRVADYDFISKNTIFPSNPHLNKKRRSFILLVSDGVTDVVVDDQGYEHYSIFEKAIQTHLNKSTTDHTVVDANSIANTISDFIFKNEARVPLLDNNGNRRKNNKNKTITQKLFANQTTSMQQATEKHKDCLEDITLHDDTTITAIELTPEIFQANSLVSAFVSDGHGGKKVANDLIENVSYHLEELVKKHNSDNGNKLHLNDELWLRNWNEPTSKKSLNKSPHMRMLARVLSRCLSRIEDFSNSIESELHTEIQHLHEAEQAFLTNSSNVTSEQKRNSFELEQNQIAENILPRAFQAAKERISEIKLPSQQQNFLDVASWKDTLDFFLHIIGEYYKPNLPIDYITPLHACDSIITACDQIISAIDDGGNDIARICNAHVSIAIEINRLKMLSAKCKQLNKIEQSNSLLAVAERISALYQHALQLGYDNQNREEAISLLLETVKLTSKHIVIEDTSIIIDNKTGLQEEALKIEKKARHSLSKPSDKAWYIADVLFALTGVGLIIEAVSLIRTGYGLFASKTTSRKLANQMIDSIENSIKPLSPAA